MARDRKESPLSKHGEDKLNEDREDKNGDSHSSRRSKLKRKKETETEEDEEETHSGEEEIDDSKKHSRSKKKKSKDKHRKRSSRRKYNDEDSKSSSSRTSDSKESESESSDYSSAEESDSEEERRRRRRERKRRERRKEREYEKEKRRKRKEKERKKRKSSAKDDKDKKKKKKNKSMGAVTNSWGKYGIIRETDMWNKRPEFTAWLSEVKKVNLETLPNWEEKQMFKEFMEDHNTATFPSKKYYNLDAYHRQKIEKQIKKGSKVVETERTIFNDEEIRRQEMMLVREKQKEEQVEVLMRAMQSGMAQDMKEQTRLREEMAYQYKLGNFEAAAAIQRRLDPDVAM